jgi:hypothetical protein
MSLAQTSSAATALREAALSTLKSRRHPKPLLNPRPVVHDTSVQLDYGQAVDSPPPPVPSPPIQHHPEPADGPAREEGEISDSESAPTVAPARQPSLLRASPVDAPSQPLPPPVKSLAYDQTSESLSQPSMSPRAIRTPDCYTTEPTRIVVDADHVRPGLTSAYCRAQLPSRSSFHAL